MHAAVAGWVAASPPSGARRRLLALLRLLPPRLRAGERVTLLWGEGPPPVLAGIAVRAVPIPAAPTWRRALAEARVLPDLLRTLDATVLDLQSLPVPAGLPCPVVLTIHDLRDLGEHRRRPRWLARAVLRRGVARAAHVVVPSAFTERELRAALPDLGPRVSVVRNQVDPGWLCAPAAAAAEPCVLHVGHLEPRKNLALLLRAYAQAQATAPLPPLVLAGQDRGEGRRLRALAARLGIAGRVRWPGAVGDARLRALYEAAVVVCVPSLYEGFGLPALEALTLGKRVLVSDRGALPEVVGAAGVVLAADDVHAWARALTEHDGVAPAPPPPPADAAAALLALWRSPAAR